MRMQHNKNKKQSIELQVFEQDLTYLHPTSEPHRTQNVSTTVCTPVIIILSSFSPVVTFTLLSQSKILGVLLRRKLYNNTCNYK